MAEFDRILECIPRLRRYARALLGARTEADDLVQDTLERAWSRLDHFRIGSEPRVWLFSVMHNLFVDQRRAARARPTEALDEALEVQAASSPADVLELRRLAEAVQRLPEPQREVLLLVGLEGLTYEEAARTLGVPVGTVMSRLSRGREAVRSGLLKAAPGPSLRVIE